MAVPYTFATATSAIPLSNLDSNFATAITIGSTATYLGNTTTTIAGLTLTSPTLTTPALGTPSSGVLTNCTGYPSSAISGTISLTTQVTGTLAVTNGGTGVTTSTGSGSNVLSTSPTLVTPILGTPTSATLTNATGYTTANLVGTISNAQLANSTISGVSLGGNLANLTAGTNITFSSGTTYNGSSAITINATAGTQVYPGAGIANSTGTAWGTSYTTTGTGTVIALATSPTFVTPILGTPTSATLTNATGLPLTTGVTGTLSIANGGTNATATPTAGAVPYGTGTAYAFTSAGSTGQVLTSNGSSAPTWATPSSGAMNLISTLTANNTSGSLIWRGLTGYNQYILIFDNLKGASGFGELDVVYGYGSTPTYITSGYSNVWYTNTTSTSVTADFNTATSFASITKVTQQINSGLITFTGFTSLQSVLSSGTSMAQYSLSAFNVGVGTVAASVSSGGVPITALKLMYSTGSTNFFSGTASLYGISS